jgi:hypothetical protein
MLFIHSYKDYLYGQIAGQQYSIMFLWQMKLGRIHDHVKILAYNGDDDDNEDGDIDNDDVGGEDKHRFLKSDKKGFIFSAVRLSDGNTYKCEAKKQNQQEIMYFYMHVGK